MYCVRKITEDITWLGVNDRRLSRFESAYPIPEGVSYNAYLLSDEKTVLLDTVDKAVASRFFENLAHALGGRPLDYLIVNHMEPDHTATLEDLLLRHPETKVVLNSKTLDMVKQFFDFDIDSRAILVKEGDTLTTGRHTLTFLMAPMVHWPEVMVTYDMTDKTLFSADAFGTFGALNGYIFADELDFAHDLLPDARRYYTNIVGKYGTQVESLLNKMAAHEVKTVCPLHGPIWRANIDWFVEKYQKWATWQPEEKGVVIAYASIYGHTENAADIVANALSERGVRNIEMYDVAVTDPSYILSDCFRYSHLVFAAPTYNAGLFTTMDTLLRELAAHGLRGRTVALIENGTWAPQSGQLMRAILEGMKDIYLLENSVTVRSAVKAPQEAELRALAGALADSMK
ncbi:MAG: FprA family A-type flavoprotein [Oscillospiraceae bacterium]|jgi:flavorubredoxin